MVQGLYLGDYINDADADPTNEVDVTAQNGLLMGNGTSVSGLVGTADGQVAKWDAGSGLWVAGPVEGGRSVWSQNASTAYYETGLVGIGTDSPAGELAISFNSNSAIIVARRSRLFTANF